MDHIFEKCIVRLNTSAHLLYLKCIPYQRKDNIFGDGDLSYNSFRNHHRPHLNMNASIKIIIFREIVVKTFQTCLAKYYQIFSSYATK